MLAGVLLMYVGSGCSQKPARVYKIAYSGRTHQNPDSADAQVPQSPNNQIPGPGSTQPTADQLNPFAPRPAPRVIHSYHIGPSDVLQIKIFQLTDLEKEAVLIQPVDRRGQIYLPLLNQYMLRVLLEFQVVSQSNFEKGIYQQLPKA